MSETVKVVRIGLGPIVSRTFTFALYLLLNWAWAYYTAKMLPFQKPKLANMGSQGNLCEDVHPSGSLEPLMRLTAENDGNHNVLDELSYNPDIPTTNCLSSMPNKNVTVPLSSGIYGQQLQPSSLGTEQNLNNDNICTQSCRAIQQQEGNFDVPPNSQGSDKQVMMDPFQEANTPTMDNDLFYFFTYFINSFLLILSQNQISRFKCSNNATTISWTPSTASYQHVPFSSSSGMYGQQPLVPSSLVGQQEEPSASRLVNTLTRYIRPPTCPQQCLPYMYPSSSTNPQCNISHRPRLQFPSSSSRNICKCKLQRRPQRQSNQCLERGESSSVSQRQQQHQQGRNFHVQPNNQGLYNQMMMDSAPRRSEALTGVNQQLNERTTSLEEPNIPTMRAIQITQLTYNPTIPSRIEIHVPFASSSGMHSQQPLAPSSLVGGQDHLFLNN
ncbi:hypothetical protein YC2023_109992 [Brassica napus]